MNTNVDSKTVFKFLDAQQLAKRVWPNPAMMLAKNSTLSMGCPVEYNLTRVELKSFTFSAESKSLSIHNAFLCTIPKHLVFTMVVNTDFIGSLDSNPFKFQHYDISNISLFVNGKHFPYEVPSLGVDHEKISVMVYRIFFQASGIYHSN